MDYIVMPTAEAAAEWGEFLGAPSTGLTANGFRVHCRGERIYFSDGATDFMRNWYPDNDGSVTEDEGGQLMMWLAGHPYEVHRES